MTEFPDEWVTEVLDLCDDEAVALWTAIQSGFLISAHPTDLLVRTYSLIRLLEERIGVVLIPGRELSKVIVAVPGVGWLPAVLQLLAEAGAFVECSKAECGVVSALISEGRAEWAARRVADLCIGRDSGNGEGRS